MRPAIRLLVFASLAGAAFGCHVDKLVDPAPDRVLVATPTRVLLTAPEGSGTHIPSRVVVTSAHGDSVSWSARLARQSSWLTLQDTAGATPDTLRFEVAPGDLAVGRYHDTLLVVPRDPELATLRVPVELQVGECQVTEVTVPAQIRDSLRTSDCGSSHRTDAFARRYRFQATAHDTLVVGLASAQFDGYLRIDSAATAAGTPIATADDCPSASFDACLPLLVLPSTGAYTIEVTTTGAGATTGSFTLTVDRPRAPTALTGLGQFREDSSTAVAVGGVVTAPAFVAGVDLQDPDAGDSLSLEVEVQPVGTPFTNTATGTSAARPAGGQAQVRISGLTDATSYHWQARARDRTGRTSAWRSFGDNPESAADIRVQVTATRLAFRVQPTTTAAGDSISPAIEVSAVDGEGHVITSFTGTVSVGLTGGTSGAVLSGDGTVSAIAGVATFPGLSVNRSGTGYHLHATATGLVDVSSDAFAVTAGSATHLTFTVQPATTAVGRPITPAVKVTAWDAQENIATGFTGSVTVALAHDGSLLQNAKLSGLLTTTAAAGIATFSDLSIDQPGTGFTLGVSGSALRGDTSATFAVTPIGGTATQQSFSSPPSDAEAGQAIAPPVEVAILDALGAPVTTFAGTVALTLIDGTSGAVLSGTRTASVVGGQARFSDLRVDRPGTGYRLRATTAGLPQANSPPFDVTAPPPTTGELTVATATSGPDPDPDGYTLTVDANGRAIGPNASTTFSNLPAGDHVITLAGIAANCTVGGSNPRTVTVPAGGTAHVDLAITCTAIGPTTGSLQVSTATGGSDLDSDGYTVTVAGAERHLGVNATVTFTDLPPGSHEVALGGVASNCTVAGSNPRSVSVTAGSTATTSFAVSCTSTGPTTGALTVTTATGGSDLDPDGYTVAVDGAAQSIGVNSSVTFTSLTPGSHAVALNGVASNCAVSGSNPRSVSVTAGSTATTGFTISCTGEPPPPPTATALRFASQPPSLMVLGSGFGVSVEGIGAGGQRVTGYTGTISLSLQGGPLALLSGTTTVQAVNGVANFSGLAITGACVECRLVATASGVSSASSSTFTVVGL